MPTLKTNVDFIDSIDLKNDAQGKTVFCVCVNDFQIHEPLLSECGRFDVDPVQTYGITIEQARVLDHLNKSLEEATQEALDAGCAKIQNQLGVPSGDFAGIFFSDEKTINTIRESLGTYMLEELRQLPESVLEERFDRLRSGPNLSRPQNA